MKRIGILHGPNLDRLGTRETSIYGEGTLADLKERLRALAETLGVEIAFAQSNHEGTMVEQVWHWADEGFDGLIVNAGAYTHTSIALHDAVKGSQLPLVEVHLSNVYQREAFRHHSFLSPVALGVIAGLGFAGYDAALRYLCERA